MMVVSGSIARAAEVRDRWGTMVEVVVVERDLSAGSPLLPGALTIARRPAAIVADDALGQLPSADESLRRTLRRGEVVTLRDLRSTSSAMEVPSGRRAISVPMDASVPSLVAGDVVDFFVFADTAPGLAANRTADFDTSGIVIDVSTDAFVVAVLETVAGEVAQATRNRSVVVALRSASVR
jgi:Flp pilus assembly protein CpaB